LIILIFKFGKGSQNSYELFVLTVPFFIALEDIFANFILQLLNFVGCNLYIWIPHLCLKIIEAITYEKS